MGLTEWIIDDTQVMFHLITFIFKVRNGQEAMNRANSKQSSSTSGHSDRDVTYFNRTLIIILHLICLLTKLLTHLNMEQIHRVKQAIFEFLRADPRGRNGATPLHLACARESSSVGRYPICQFPSLDAIMLLLECGANPNATDNDSNSCLHVAALNKPAKPLVVHELVEAGAHLDAVNKDGRSFASLLKGQSIHEIINPLRFTNLQCLAAKVIQTNNIAYHGYLSPGLEEFVNLH